MTESKKRKRSSRRRQKQQKQVEDFVIPTGDSDNEACQHAVSQDRDQPLLEAESKKRKRSSRRRQQKRVEAAVIPAEDSDSEACQHTPPPPPALENNGNYFSGDEEEENGGELFTATTFEQGPVVEYADAYAQQQQIRILEQVEEHADIWIYNNQSLCAASLTSKMRKLLSEDRTQLQENILGLHRAKKLLVRDVLMPLQNPALYEAPFPSPHILCIYGREGSGKRGLVCSFAKQHAINVIVVDKFYTTGNWIEILLQAACVIRPCIILFDSCDHHFGNGNQDGAAWSVQLLYFMNRLLSGVKNVWLILSGKMMPMMMHTEISRIVSGSSVYAEPPEDEQKTEMFQRVFADGWGPDRWTGDLYGQFLGKVITEYSEAANFKDVYDFAKRLYCCRLSELDKETLLELPKKDERLMPSGDALQKELGLLTNEKRMTRHDPAAIQKAYMQQEGR